MKMSKVTMLILVVALGISGCMGGKALKQQLQAAMPDMDRGEFVSAVKARMANAGMQYDLDEVGEVELYARFVNAHARAVGDIRTMQQAELESCALEWRFAMQLLKETMEPLVAGSEAFAAVSTGVFLLKGGPEGDRINQKQTQGQRAEGGAGGSGGQGGQGGAGGQGGQGGDGGDNCNIFNPVNLQY